MNDDVAVTAALELPDLLHVCTQTRAEAMGIFYSINILRHDIDDFDIRTMVSWDELRHSMGMTNIPYDDSVYFNGNPNWRNLKRWLDATREYKARPLGNLAWSVMPYAEVSRLHGITGKLRVAPRWQ